MRIVFHGDESVSYVRVNMQFRRHVHFTQLAINGDGAHRRISVGVPVKQAHWRRFVVEREIVDHRRIVPFGGIRSVGAVFKNVSGIDGRGKIHVAGDFVKFVYRFVGGFTARRRVLCRRCERFRV